MAVWWPCSLYVRSSWRFSALCRERRTALQMSARPMTVTADCSVRNNPPMNIMALNYLNITDKVICPMIKTCASSWLSDNFLPSPDNQAGKKYIITSHIGLIDYRQNLNAFDYMRHDSNGCQVGQIDRPAVVVPAPRCAKTFTLRIAKRCLSAEWISRCAPIFTSGREATSFQWWLRSQSIT